MEKNLKLMEAQSNIETAEFEARLWGEEVESGISPSKLDHISSNEYKPTQVTVASIAPHIPGKTNFEISKFKAEPSIHYSPHHYQRGGAKPKLRSSLNHAAEIKVCYKRVPGYHPRTTNCAKIKNCYNHERRVRYA